MTDAKKNGSSSKEGASGTPSADSDDTAETKNEKTGIGSTAAGAAPSTTAKSGEDAEKLLKADHRKVEQLFQQYKGAKDDTKKAELAQQICNELIVHTKLEEEIFYPACREKDVEDDSLDEAQVEHDGAKVMIAELIEGSPDDDYYDAKVTVLSEYIEHHVGEEEKASDGIFAKARTAGVDMNALGLKIQARKAELMGQIDTLGSKPPKLKSLDLSSIAGTRNQERNSMARYSNDRHRDDQGRFMSDDDDHRNGRSSSRGGYSSRSRYDDDHDRSGNGGRSSGLNDRDRDDQGRFMSDDDRGGRSSSRGGYSSRSRDDDDNYRGNNNRFSSSNDRERDDQGRFMSDDDRGSSRGGYSTRSSRDDYDDDRGGRDMSSSRGGRGQNQGHGGWFGDSERHSEAAERGWEGRSSSPGSSSSRSRYDDDDDRGGRSMSSSRSGGRGQDQGQGHGGWYGDSQGHSEAAERGWEHRNSGRNSSSSRRSMHDDDDNRGNRSSSSSRSGGRGQNQGHGGWFGDSEGHSEAARRGWQDR